MVHYQTLFWPAVAVAVAAVIARGFWLYRASLTWPTADGSITRVDIERRRDTSGPYVRATFTYEFLDPNGLRLSGTWYKNFSSEQEARDFAARELPVGKPVVVRFSPRNPALNDLELDSWTYTNDRPTSLNI
ncbi:MAG TPA: DUF3592 domain-containing protein [Candidatus Sulfotelmatobacter sp.]|nr:DUF3592 domain-containing protein [Candidatus Sulfotelmatobacter sp.]